MTLVEKINKQLKKYVQNDNNKNVASVHKAKSNAMLLKYSERMREILREEVSLMISTTTDDDFLNYINIDKSVSVKKKQGKEFLSVGIYFDKNMVTRDSLYPEQYGDVYMPTIINNEWNIKTSNQVYGYDRHGNFKVGTKKWKYIQDKGFMQRAVNRFNIEMSSKGVKAEYSSDYTGGTY